MLIGRYGMIVPILALAGSMAAKRRVAPSLGTFPTTGALWVVLLIGVVDHRRRADLLPGARAGPDRRAAPPERREGLLSHEPRHPSLSVDLGRGTRRFQRFVTLGGAKPAGEPPRAARHLRPGAPPGGLPHAVPQARPAPADQEPGHVRGRDHGRPGDPHRARRRRPASSRPAGRPASGFELQIAVWLWFTVLFATYAEAVAEARGRAQAATLRQTRSETIAHRRARRRHARGRRLVRAAHGRHRRRRARARRSPATATSSRASAYVNEAAITGESAPVLKEPGHGHPQLGHRRHDARQRPPRRSASRPTRARPSSTG